MAPPPATLPPAVQLPEPAPPSSQPEAPPSDSSDGDSLPEGLVCAICLQLVHEPVLWPAAAESCGHAFCKRCTLACVATANPCCPLCRAPAAEGVTAEDLVVDSATLERIESEVPAIHASRVAAELVDSRLRATLPDIMLYRLDEKYAFKAGYVIDLRLKEPTHLWMLTKLLVTGVRRIGLLFPATTSGDQNGRIATVLNLPFNPPTMSLNAAVGRVGMERHSKGSCHLRLRVSGEFFRAMLIEHAAPTAEEMPLYRTVNSPMMAGSSQPRHSAAYLASQARLGIAKAVIAKNEAVLPAKVAEALGHEYIEPAPPPSQPASSAPSSGTVTPESSSRRRSSSPPMFGPYVRRRTCTHTPAPIQRVFPFFFAPRLPGRNARGRSRYLTHVRCVSVCTGRFRLCARDAQCLKDACYSGRYLQHRVAVREFGQELLHVGAKLRAAPGPLVSRGVPPCLVRRRRLSPCGRLQCLVWLLCVCRVRAVRGSLVPVQCVAPRVACLFA